MGLKQRLEEIAKLDEKHSLAEARRRAYLQRAATKQHNKIARAIFNSIPEEAALARERDTNFIVLWSHPDLPDAVYRIRDGVAGRLIELIRNEGLYSSLFTSGKALCLRI